MDSPYEIDYEETYAPVGRQVSLRILLAVAVSKNMSIRHLDIKTPYLNGELDEDIYMEQPKGYVVPGKEHMVCKLQKSLYGLKQAGRCWNEKQNSILETLGFVRNQAEKCVYSKRNICILADTTGFAGLSHHYIPRP